MSLSLLLLSKQFLLVIIYFMILCVMVRNVTDLCCSHFLSMYKLGFVCVTYFCNRVCNSFSSQCILIEASHFWNFSWAAIGVLRSVLTLNFSFRFYKLGCSFFVSFPSLCFQVQTGRYLGTKWFCWCKLTLPLWRGNYLPYSCLNVSSYWH